MREEKRELYREGTPDNLKKGYTDLVYGGSGVEVDKGVISASGGSGGGGEEGAVFQIIVQDPAGGQNYCTIVSQSFTFDDLLTVYNSGAMPVIYISNEGSEYAETFHAAICDIVNTTYQEDPYGFEFKFEAISLTEGDDAVLIGQTIYTIGVDSELTLVQKTSASYNVQYAIS